MSGPLTVTFLGTGTSVGVPVLTCDCRVCTSGEPRNRRLRASILLEWDCVEAVDGERAHVLVDTATDLRQQALAAGLDNVDAVLYTHHHADHILGLDELRMYYFRQGRPLPLYGRAETMRAIRETFAYAFDDAARGVPRLVLNEIDGPLDLLGRSVIPVPVEHDRWTIFAYRVGGFAYVTDCSAIPDGSLAALSGAEVLVLDALRREPHPAHFSLEEALAEIDRLQPRRTYLTHLSHVFDHAELEAELPDDVHVAHDGLVLEIAEGAAG